MQRYIDHIKELGKDTLSNPFWKDNPYLKPLLAGFLNEISYLEFKFFKDQTFDAAAEMDKVWNLYIFNPVIKHAYNVSNTGMGLQNLKQDFLNKKIPSIEHLYFNDFMQNYAFYDGTPVMEVLKEIERYNSLWFRFKRKLGRMLKRNKGGLY